MTTPSVRVSFAVDGLRYAISIDARVEAARFFVAVELRDGSRILLASGLLDSSAPYGFDVFVNYDDAPLPPAVERALCGAWLRWRLEQRYPGST